MSLPLSSFVVTLCLGVGFVSLPSPVESLPLKSISLNPNFTEAISNRQIAQNKLRRPQQSTFNPSAITQASANPRTAEDFLNQIGRAHV